MKKKHKTEFINAMDKISLFKDGATFYYNKENYAHAAFMLHQVIELSLTALEILFLRKRIRSHCIKLHLSYIEIEIPDLNLAFPTYTEDELTLLRLLDKAYINVRYKKAYSIERKQIEVIMGWVHNLERSIGTIL
jgi:HEPN domain-containing protein